MRDGDSYKRRQPEDFVIGSGFTREFVVEANDITQFSASSGDYHPLHRDADLARRRGFLGVPVHGMLVASKCSGFVARDVVGIHGLIVSMTAEFRLPVYVGELLYWRAQVVRVAAAAGTVELTWQVANQSGAMVQRGTCCVHLSVAA